MHSTRLWLTILFLAVICVFPALPIQGATIQGAFKYAGLPAKTTFPNHSNIFVMAWDSVKDLRYIGTANFSSGTYSIPGVPAGDHSITIKLSTYVDTDTILTSGDVGANSYCKVGSESVITLDIDLLYAFHVTQPLDSKGIWNGITTVCPPGPEVPGTFTFAWNPIPQAVSYEVRVLRRTCTDTIRGDIQTTTSTSVQIKQLEAANEAYIKVELTATGFGGQTLSTNPYINYGTSTQSSGIFLHAATGNARPKNHAGASFIVGVAHSPGTPPTFWKSDLILRNPTSVPISSILTFTPKDKDGLVNYQSANVDVPANSCRVITDVIDTVFHAAGAGSLEVFPAQLDAAVRTYTPGGGAGLYGQSYEPITADQMAYRATTSQVIGRGGVAKGAQRTNLTIAEVWGESAEVLVVLLDRDGHEVGRKTYSLGPFSNTQINDLVAKLGGPEVFAEGQVTLEVTSGSGRVGGCLSIVDNQSQDPTTLVLIRR